MGGAVVLLGWIYIFNNFLLLLTPIFKKLYYTRPKLNRVKPFELYLKLEINILYSNELFLDSEGLCCNDIKLGI